MNGFPRLPVLVLALAALAACSSKVDEAPPASAEVVEAPAAAAESLPDERFDTAPAQAPDDAPAALVTVDWDDLQGLVGTYPHELEGRAMGPVLREIRSVLGDKAMRLQRNMQVSGPVQEEDGIYYVTGNAPHEGGKEQAYVLLDPAARQVEVGLWEDGKLTVYRSGATALPQPADVRTMIANAEAH